MSGTRSPPSGLASPRKPTEQELQAQAEQQLNQLLGELRLLESYYQEIVAREQAASNALTETRSAIDAIDALAQKPKNEALLPIGGGILLPVNEIEVKRLVVSVGSGVAIEKDVDSTRTFLQSRQKELEKAVTTLEQQRREIASRLEQGRATLSAMTGQA